MCDDDNRDAAGARTHHGAPAPRSRIVGCLIAAAINLGLIWLLTVIPGWRWVPFLSDDFSRVVGLVTLSFAISVVVNLVYVALDPPWVKQLGDAFTTAVAFSVMLQLLQVFPFAAAWAAWHVVFRVFLVLGCVGAAIGVIANLVKLAQGASRGLDAR